MTKQIIFTHHYTNSVDYEIIIKLKTNDFDWIDPLREVWVDGNKLYIDNGRYVYDYEFSQMTDYNIRPYDGENIFDYQGGNL